MAPENRGKFCNRVGHGGKVMRRHIALHKLRRRLHARINYEVHRYLIRTKPTSILPCGACYTIPGPVTFYQLLARFGSAEAALAALPEVARRGGRARALSLFPRAAAERELQLLQAMGGQLVAWGEPDYPIALAALDDAPPLISIKGDVSLLTRNAFAVVGARNASANGRRFARDIALQLGQHGIVVVSGLARGIDAAAHEGAIASGTIAVLAGGIDQVYPEENRGLHEQIAERGVLIAELPVGTEPQARHFPRRNRIISGCSLGVLVVEAALRSGSLITARFALEQGRDVFAVPGSPLDPRCRGANDLIRNGAILCETVDDIVRELQPRLGATLDERKREAFTSSESIPPGDSELAHGRARTRRIALTHPGTG